MNVIHKLGLVQLLKNKKRTAITLLSILLSVAMITAVVGFVFSAKEAMREALIAGGGDHHVDVWDVEEDKLLEIAQDSEIESYRIIQTNGGPVLKFRLKNPSRSYAQTTQQIMERHGVLDTATIIYNQDLLAAEGHIASDSVMTMLYLLGVILCGTVMGGSILVISNAFGISANERIRQFGMLKSVGATQKQIRATVMFEGVLLAAIGIPLGILLGLGIQYVVLFISNILLADLNAINKNKFFLKVVFSFAAIMIASAVSLVTILLSAWLPAYKAAKISAIDAVRLTNQLTIKPKKVRTTGLVAKLFGIEGMVAAKSLKRSKAKYRATVVSLVISIVLYIVSSSFGTLLLQSSSMMYQSTEGYNIGVNSYNLEKNTAMTFERFDQFVQGVEHEKYTYSKAVTVAMAPQAGFVHPALQAKLSEGMGGDITSATILSVSPEEFTAICNNAGVKPEEMRNTGGTNAILLNYAMFSSGSQLEVLAPYVFKQDMSLFLESGDIKTQVNLVGQIKEATYQLAAYTNRFPPSPILILEESVFDRLVSSLPQDYISIAYAWLLECANPEQADKSIKEFIQSNDLAETVFCANYDQEAKMIKNLNTLIMVFVYGFIAMLTLIGVTSVIGTISTNINLRRQEFAMLSSVGMEPKSMKKMLNLESLLYGLKALAIGLPIGMLLTYLLYSAFNIKFSFVFTLPWMHILIAMAAVLLITFFTMRISAKKLFSSNIVDALRETNI